MTRKTPPRVLIVDDDAGMRTSLDRVMRAKGFRTAVATDGHEAIALAAEQEIDCVLMDLRMPEMNGVETFRRLRRVSPESAVIFMSAYASSKLAAEALEEGGLQVISKPLDLGRLCQMVEEQIKTRPILIVNDDAPFTENLRRTLERQGLSVLTANNAEQAVEAFSKRPRAIAIVDMALDSERGLHVLRATKRLNPTMHALVISDTPAPDACLEPALGIEADACFERPAAIDDLLRAIEVRLSR